MNNRRRVINMIEQNHTSLKNRITEIENGLLTDFTEGDSHP